MQKQMTDINLIDTFERIPVSIFKDLKEGSIYAADEIANLIKEKQSKNEMCVLGLATGSTPKTLYSELVIKHKKE
jgi:glucosamine-6-phosphate deaminase